MKTVLLALATDNDNSLPRSHGEWELCIYKSPDMIGSALVYLCPPDIRCTPTAEYRGAKKILIHFDDGGAIAADCPIIYEDKMGIVLTLGELIVKVYTLGGVSESKVLACMMEAICSLALGDDAGASVSDGVSMLREMIDRSFADPEFRVAEVIDNLGYNKDYMRRLFKSEVGKTPTDYLIDRRIANARRLLAGAETRDLSITKVAFMCGFYDANYFTRVFKKETAMLPSEYRRASRRK